MTTSVYKKTSEADRASRLYWRRCSLCGLPVTVAAALCLRALVPSHSCSVVREDLLTWHIADEAVGTCYVIGAHRLVPDVPLCV